MQRRWRWRHRVETRIPRRWERTSCCRPRSNWPEHWWVHRPVAGAVGRSVHTQHSRFAAMAAALTIYMLYEWPYIVNNGSEIIKGVTLCYCLRWLVAQFLRNAMQLPRPVFVTHGSLFVLRAVHTCIAFFRWLELYLISYLTSRLISLYIDTSHVMESAAPVSLYDPVITCTWSMQLYQDVMV